MSGRRIVSQLILSLCLLGIAACQNVDRQAPQRMKIGVIFPFSGYSAASGMDLKAGVSLAAEIVNGTFDLPLALAKNQGLSRHGHTTIELVFKDSHSSRATAAGLVGELVHNQGVVALMGCYNSGVTAAASEEAEALDVPFVNATSTSPLLTRRKLRYFFRTTPGDGMFAQNFFDFFADMAKTDPAGVPKRLLLVYENRLWGTNVALVEKKIAARYGYRVVADVPYSADDKAFDTELHQIGGALPGIILQASYADDALAFMKAYKAAGVNPVAIVAMDAGFVSPSFAGALGPTAEYVFSREVWATDLAAKIPLAGTVNRLFRQRNGHDMSGNSARAFTAMMVLADALNRARTLDSEGIRKALRDTHIPAQDLIMPWKGVRFDPQSGQNVLGRGIIVQMQKGRYRTVWPAVLASAPAVWPMPAWTRRGAHP